MNRQEIMTVLPHRHSMLLVNNVVLDGEIARGEYQFRGDKWFFDGHFPDHPVVPGVVLCEVVAQSACVLVRQYATEDMVPYLVEVNQARFRNLVRPGDKFETQCRLVRKRNRRIAKSEQAKAEGFKDVAGIPLNAFGFGAKNGRFSVYKS